MDELLDLLRDEMNALRGLERLLRLNEVRTLWALATIQVRAKLQEAVLDRRPEDVRLWIVDQRRAQKDYVSMTVAQLRRVAAGRRIDDYQSMDKISLIIELEQCDARSDSLLSRVNDETCPTIEFEAQWL